MSTNLRSKIAILLIIIFSCTYSPVALCQQPVYDSETVPAHSQLPLVQVHTIAHATTRGLLARATGSSAIELHTIIGSLTGFGLLRVDEQVTAGGVLRLGSRIQVGQASCAQADLGMRGKLMLAADSDLTITATDNTVYTKLIAGVVKIELPAGVYGFVEAANTLVMNRTDRPAAFTVRVVDGRAAINTYTGAVVQTQISDGEYMIAFLTRREEKLKPNNSLELQVKVTDKQERPRPGMVIVFQSRDLTGNTAGSFSPATAVTDANGIARTNFLAGSQPGKLAITATIAGTAAMATMTINIQGGAIFGLNTMQIVTLAGIAAAGGFGLQQSIRQRDNRDRVDSGLTLGADLEVIGRD
ncbi:MAG: Ig-like domain-containing protein [Acidobacteriota bacterium]